MHQWIQNEIPDIGKDRQTDDEATQGQRERHPRLTNQPDHRQGDSLDPARVFQRLGKQRPEHDHHRDTLNRAPEPLLERVDEGFAIDARDQREENDRDKQRDKDMPVKTCDQQEEQRDDGHQAGNGDQRAFGDHGMRGIRKPGQDLVWSVTTTE